MGCRNCAEGCCCECKNTDCKLCVKKTETYYYKGTDILNYTFIAPKCSWSGYSHDHKHICFTCKTIRESDYNDFCPTCNNTFNNSVSPVVRIPPKNKTKSWKLLELLIKATDLQNAKSNTLADYYINNGTIGCKTHADKKIRDLIYIPLNFRQYKEWIPFMLNTKIPN